MTEHHFQYGPDIPDMPADREKELSGQFEDPGLDFLFFEDMAG